MIKRNRYIGSTLESLLEETGELPMKKPPPITHNAQLDLHLGDTITVNGIWEGKNVPAVVVGFSGNGKPTIAIDAKHKAGDNLGTKPIHPDYTHRIDEDDGFWTLDENDTSVFQHETAMGLRLGQEIEVGRTNKGYAITGTQTWDTTGKYPPLKGKVIGFKRDRKGNPTKPLILIKREEQDFRADCGRFDYNKEGDIADRYITGDLSGDFDDNVYGGDAFLYLTDPQSFKTQTIHSLDPPFDNGSASDSKPQDTNVTDKDIEGETIMGTNNKSDRLAFMDMVKDDAGNAAYRIASTQITRGMKAAILSVLNKQGGSNEGLKAMSEMLDTEWGTALISMLAGLGATYLPGSTGKDERVQRLATELRVNGMGVVGNEVMDISLEYFMPVIMNALSAIPETATQTRVAPAASKKNEKEQYSEEEITAPAKQARV